MKESSSNIILIFGENIRISRNKRGLTITALSKKSSYNRESLSSLEKGQLSDISFKHSLSLAKALDIDYPVLFSRNFNSTIETLPLYLDDNFLSIYITNVKTELARNGLYQKAIYPRVNIEESTVSRIFQGSTTNPRLSTLVRIAEAINVHDIQQLLKRR